MFIRVKSKVFEESLPVLVSYGLFQSYKVWSDVLTHFGEGMVVPAGRIYEAVGKEGFHGSIFDFEFATIVEEQLQAILRSRVLKHRYLAP